MIIKHIFNPLSMKKYFWLSLLLAGNLQVGFSQTESSAKESEIPLAMKEFIEKNYTGHSHLKFYKEKERDSLYFEAVFHLKEDEYSLTFDHHGNLHETEVELPFKELPSEIAKLVKDYLKTAFIHYKINRTEEVDQKGKLMYEFTVKGKNKIKTSYYEIYFDRKGIFLKMDEIQLNPIPSLF